MILVLGTAAILLGLVLVFADQRLGRFGPRGPESGAALMRSMGMILLVAGGLTFLYWAQ